MNVNVGSIPSGVWIGLGIVAAITLLLLLRGRLGHSLLDGLDRLQNACATLAQKGLYLQRLVVGTLHNLSGKDDVEAGGVAVASVQEEHHTSEVFVLILRLLGLYLAYNVALGLLVLDQARMGVVILGTDGGGGGLPGNLSISQVLGNLGWSMGILLGAFFVEALLPRWPIDLEFLPPTWRETALPRIVVRFLVFTGVVLMFFYVAIVAVAAQLKLMDVPWPAAQLVAATLQLVLVNLVAIVGGLWVLMLGVAALFALGCLAVQLIAAILHVILKAWVKPVKVPLIGGGSSGGERGGQGAIQQPSWPVTGTAGVPLEQKVISAGTITPYKTSVVTAGNFGQRVMLPLATGLLDLQAKGAMRAGAFIPTGQAPDGIIDRTIRASGAKVISSTAADWAVARQGPGDETETLLEQVCLKLQQVTPALAGEELTLLALGHEHVKSLREPLTRFKAAMKRQVLVLLVEVPVNRLGREDVRAALDEAEALWRDNIVATTILVDREKPYKSRQAREQQERLLTHSLNGLMVAHDHSHLNRTGAELFRELGEFSPFLGVATATVVLQPGEQLKGFDPGRWTGGNTRGRGNVEQTREALTGLAEHLLHDESVRLFPMAIQPERDRLGGEVFTVFAKNDPGYKAVQEGIELWAAEYHTGIPLVFVAGPGALSASPSKHYQAEWTWWYGFSLDDIFSQLGDTTMERQLPTSSGRGAAIAAAAPTQAVPARSRGKQTNSSGSRPRGRQTDETQVVRPMRPTRRGRRTPLRVMEQ